MDWKLVAMVGISLALSGCSEASSGSNGDENRASTYVRSERAAPALRMSASEFRQTVSGLSKSEVAARFGRPDSVHPDGSWRYDHLPVHDDDGGFQTGVYVVFDGAVARGAIQ